MTPEQRAADWFTLPPVARTKAWLAREFRKAMAGNWQDMDTAPLDGTRVLVKCNIYDYVSGFHEPAIIGDEILEAWYTSVFGDPPCWAKWCGSPDTHSTHRPKPTAWMHKPE